MARRGYVQLVNGFYDNDKIRDLVRMGRADSVGVYCMAISLCGDRLTDGFVPRRAMLSNIGALSSSDRDVSATLISLSCVGTDLLSAFFLSLCCSWRDK